MTYSSKRHQSMHKGHNGLDPIPEATILIGAFMFLQPSLAATSAEHTPTVLNRPTTLFARYTSRGQE